MKNNRVKRVLSMVLALCMVIGMLPMMSFAKDIFVYDVPRYDIPTHDFRKAVLCYSASNMHWSSYSTQGMTPSEITDLNQTTAGAETEIYPQSSAVTKPWAYVDGSAEYSAIDFRGGYCFNFDAAEDAYVQFKVKVDSGLYSLNSLNSVTYYSGVLNVYLAPADAADAMAEEYLLGSMDLSCSYAQCPTNKSGVNANDYWPHKFSFGTKQIEGGEYILTYKLKQQGRNGVANSCYMSGFSFDPIELNIDVPATIAKGKATKIPIAMTAADVSVTYSASSDKEDVIKASIYKENILLLEPMAASGSAKITITANDGTSDVATKTVEVSIMEEDPRDFNYDLRKLVEFFTPGCGWSQWWQKGYDPTGITDLAMTTKGDAKEIFPTSSIVTDPWCVTGATATYRQIHYQYGAYYDFSTDANAYLQFKIALDQDGEFNIKTLNTVNYYAPVLNVYLAPESDAANATDAKYLLGNFNASCTWSNCPSNGGGVNGGNWNPTEFDLGVHTLDAGNYIVTYQFKANGMNGVATRAFFAGLKFDNTYVDPMTVTLKASELSEVVVGKTGDTTLTLLDVAEDPVEFAKENVTVTVSDTNIADATLSDDGKTITVTGKQKGTTTIKAKVYLTEKSNDEIEIPVTVIGDKNVKELRAGELKDVAVGSSRTTALYVVNGNDEIESVDMTGAQITVENPEIAKAVNYASGGTNVVVTGLSVGETTVNVTCGAISIAIPVKVIDKYPEVAARKMHYDFLKLSSRHENGQNKARQPGEIINLEQTTKGHANEIYPKSKIVTDPWCFVATDVSQVPSALGYPPYWFDPNNSYVYGIRLDAAAKQNGWARYKIEVPADGLYQGVIYTARHYTCGITDIYLAPVDAENPMDSKYSLGSHDLYRKYDKSQDAANWVVRQEYGGAMLSAGEYYVTYHVPKTTSPEGGYYSYSSSFELEPISDDVTMNFTLGDSATLKAATTYNMPMALSLSNGVALNLNNAVINVESDNTMAADAEIYTDPLTNQVSLKLIGNTMGSANVHLVATMNGVQIADRNVAVTVAPAGILTSIDLGFDGYDNNRISTKMTPKLVYTMYDQDGDLIPQLEKSAVEYTSSNESVATVDEAGNVTPIALGETTFTATVTYNGTTVIKKYDVIVTGGKTESTYYTPEKVANARYNAENYSWARSTVAAATRAADKYVGKEELLWNAVTTQELPRGAVVGYRWDPNKFTCRYCETNLADTHGSYSWIIDPINEPFKIQCPECRRSFPSNDFESFYKLGINEQGKWSYEQAKAKNAELVEAGEDGYLKNIAYPEKGEGWGVDDGYGYRTGKTITNEKGQQEEEVHTYIAYYNHWGVWHSNGITQDALTNLINAYIYTGDAKYGRAGAILIDRIADVYSEMDTGVYFPNFSNSDSSQPAGKALGSIWECAPTKTLARAYDAFFPMMEDSQVINFLSEKAKKYDLGSAKDSAELLRLNCEDGILRAIYEGAKGGDIHGNFGMHQSSVATAAVVLDTMPETKEMIDWVMKSGSWVNESTVTGGNVLEQILATVDRDGHGNEAAPGYNSLWLSNLSILADTLAGYDGYTAADLYNNPKFIKMFTASMPLTLAQNGTAAIGDSGRVASTKNETNASLVLKAFELTGRPEFAQAVYYLYDGKVENIHGDIYSSNPEKLQQQIRDVVEKYGEYDVNSSEQITGFGFSILRGGHKYSVAGSTGVNNLQDFWIYYGGGTGHKHPDGLNLGLEAFGVNMAPDLGYPLAADGSDYYTYWSRSTLNHNTIMVNGKNHTHYNLRQGYPLHFDDSGRVKVMDVEHPLATPDASTYRRSVVMVQATDEVAYGIDFFRVVGGNDHLYSFHSQSDDVTVDGVTLVPQVDENGEYVGSYAGPDVKYGTAQSVNGYAWFKNVDKAENPGTGTFTADFKVTDFRDTVVNNEGLHLKMTMLNDFDLSEVSVTEGIPAQIEDNPEMLKFVFARRTGQNLDSLFTTVFEPYREGENYIDTLEAVPVTRADGSDAGSAARAVKVTLKSGRVDYVVYASDETVEYKVDNKFDFRGFVGVASLIDGEIAYQYLNDGTKFGDMTAQGEYTGTIADFTRENEFENSITVNLNADIDPSTLAGHHIYVDNDRELNAVYAIKDAKLNSSGQYVLDIGDITLIRSSKDAADMSKGYVYNIEAGQSFSIPLPSVSNTAPVFSQIPKQRVEANSEIKVTVTAESPADRELTYSAGVLPRGAQFDPETGILKWVPDSAQIGANFAEIKVTDGIFEEIMYIEFTVLNATGGSSSAVSNPSMGTGGGGTGGATGGDTEKPDTGKDDENDPSQGGDGEATGKKFVDLGAHLWAEDAIYRLVEKNVINGTSENTYSPGANITRADFTTLIVRAFNFEANTTENFSDVESGKYYSDTIAIAKALGIVNGGSDGKFNPTSSISRQDMMVIIARAAKVAGIELAGDVANDFTDKDEVAAYARDAVDLLISSGIIAGSNGKINPNGTATRAEVAVILDRLLK